MATLDESVSADAAWEENECLSPVSTCYGSLVDLLMCGDYEQHLSPIFKGSSSSIYIVSPLVCAEPTCEPTMPCNRCKFARQHVLRVHYVDTEDTTGSCAGGERRPTHT